MGRARVSEGKIAQLVPRLALPGLGAAPRALSLPLGQPRATNTADLGQFQSKQDCACGGRSGGQRLSLPAYLLQKHLHPSHLLARN